MEFRKMSVGGMSYGLGSTVIGLAARRRRGEVSGRMVETRKLLLSLSPYSVPYSPQNTEELERLMAMSMDASVPHVNFLDGAEDRPDRTLFLDQLLTASTDNEKQKSSLHYFLLNVALNHTVMVEVLERDEGQPGRPALRTQLSASSPDEEAFVYAAAFFGYAFIDRSDPVVTIRVRRDCLPTDGWYDNVTEGVTSWTLNDQEIQRTATASAALEGLKKAATVARENNLSPPELGAEWVDLKYEILLILPYNSARGMMSVMVREELTNRVFVFAKGADNKIVPKCTAAIAYPEPKRSELCAAHEEGIRALHTIGEHLANYGEDGLRTMTFSFKPLEEEAYDDWMRRYLDAKGDYKAMQESSAADDGIGKGLLARIVQEVESGMLLQGGTALEDKLQEGVGDTIYKLGQGGVKVLMATGDKKQTAINIAFATQMVSKEHEILDFTSDVDNATSLLLSTARYMLGSSDALTRAVENDDETWDELDLATHTLMTKPNPVVKPLRPLAMVIDGKVLSEIFDRKRQSKAKHSNSAQRSDDDDAIAPRKPSAVRRCWFAARSACTSCVSSFRDGSCERLCRLLPLRLRCGRFRTHVEVRKSMRFAKVHGLTKRQMEYQAALVTLLQACSAVVCVRCRPDQKKDVVSLISRRVKGSRTLAIGDGANDVPMITAAHVGVGIVGAEGVQAANASDYAIGRFRFLQRLLLTHGRWNYNRMAKVVLYMFYKNIAFTLAQFWYTLYTGWSGQKCYVELSTQSFNLIYTGLPILITGIWDQDLPADVTLTYPAIYEAGHRGTRLNPMLFVLYVLSAIYESVVMFFGGLFATMTSTSDATTPAIFEFGTTLFGIVVGVMTLRVLLMTDSHNWLFQSMTALSALCYIPAVYIFAWLDADGTAGVGSMLFSSASWWLAILLVTLFSQLHVMIINSYRRNFQPQYHHVVQELQLLLPRDEGEAGSCCSSRPSRVHPEGNTSHSGNDGNRSGHTTVEVNTKESGTVAVDPTRHVSSSSAAIDPRRSNSRLCLSFARRTSRWCCSLGLFGKGPWAQPAPSRHSQPVTYELFQEHLTATKQATRRSKETGVAGEWKQKTWELEEVPFEQMKWFTVDSSASPRQSLEGMEYRHRLRLVQMGILAASTLPPPPKGIDEPSPVMHHYESLLKNEEFKSKARDDRSTPSAAREAPVRVELKDMSENKQHDPVFVVPHLDVANTPGLSSPGSARDLHDVRKASPKKTELVRARSMDHIS